jgi:hypothetical protein
MTHWAMPDQDTMRRIVFQLQRPNWCIRAPSDDQGADGQWHACSGTMDVAADSLGALLDRLDWLHAT